MYPAGCADNFYEQGIPPMWFPAGCADTVTHAVHQQPDVNYIKVLEKVDFPCTVHAQRVPFKGNQLRAETG